MWVAMMINYAQTLRQDYDIGYGWNADINDHDFKHYGFWFEGWFIVNKNEDWKSNYR